MDVCTILEFRNALMHPEECLRSYVDIEFDPETLTRTKYFAECQAEYGDERVMVYAPITTEAMTMVRRANRALPARSNYVTRLKIVENEMLHAGTNREYCPLIVEQLPDGVPLSEALYTHYRNKLIDGLEALRRELERHDVSINHLHPDSIIIDRTRHWHVIRPYYATRGYGNDSEAFEKLMELITKHAISDDYDGNRLYESYSHYSITSRGDIVVHPVCEGLHRIETHDGMGFEDERGNVVIEPIYHSASDFLEDRAVVESHDHKWGVIDKSGKYIIEMVYDSIDFDEDEGISEVTLNGCTATFDYFGTQLTPWK